MPIIWQIVWVIVLIIMIWGLSKLVDRISSFAKNRRDSRPPPRKKIQAYKKTRAGTGKEAIRRLMEEGMYETALGLGRKPRPVEIKNRIIELREIHPDLSTLLVEVEEALIRNLKQYKKDCTLRDNIRKLIWLKWGETASELFTDSQIWRLVKDKPSLGTDLTSFVIQQVKEIVDKIPALDMSKGPKAVALVVRVDCPICDGGKNPPACTDCGGTGEVNLSKNDIYSQRNVCPFCQGTGRLSRYSKQLILKDLNLDALKILEGRLPKFIDMLSSGYEGVCPACGGSGLLTASGIVCTTCNGTGKHCECNQKVTFNIPSWAKEGMIIKGEGASKDSPCFARLVK